MTAKTHECMRCGEEFECIHGAACTASKHVLPVRVDAFGNPAEHCPPEPDWEWIRAYRRRAWNAAIDAALAQIIEEQAERNGPMRFDLAEKIRALKRSAP